MRNELLGYLAHVGIPKGIKLARPELAIIRASLGRPRRLSLGYLRQVGCPFCAHLIVVCLTGLETVSTLAAIS